MAQLNLPVAYFTSILDKFEYKCDITFSNSGLSTSFVETLYLDLNLGESFTEGEYLVALKEKEFVFNSKQINLQKNHFNESTKHRDFKLILKYFTELSGEQRSYPEMFCVGHYNNDSLFKKENPNQYSVYIHANAGIFDSSEESDETTHWLQDMSEELAITIRNNIIRLTTPENSSLFREEDMTNVVFPTPSSQINLDELANKSPDGLINLLFNLKSMKIHHGSGEHNINPLRELARAHSEKLDRSDILSQLVVELSSADTKNNVAYSYMRGIFVIVPGLDDFLQKCFVPETLYRRQPNALHLERLLSFQFSIIKRASSASGYFGKNGMNMEYPRGSPTISVDDCFKVSFLILYARILDDIQYNDLLVKLENQEIKYDPILARTMRPIQKNHEFNFETNIDLKTYSPALKSIVNEYLNALDNSDIVPNLNVGNSSTDQVENKIKDNINVLLSFLVDSFVELVNKQEQFNKHEQVESRAHQTDLVLEVFSKNSLFCDYAKDPDEAIANWSLVAPNETENIGFDLPTENQLRNFFLQSYRMQSLLFKNINGFAFKEKGEVINLAYFLADKDKPDTILTTQSIFSDKGSLDFIDLYVIEEEFQFTPDIAKALADICSEDEFKSGPKYLNLSIHMPMSGTPEIIDENYHIGNHLSDSRFFLPKVINVADGSPDSSIIGADKTAGIYILVGFTEFIGSIRDGHFTVTTLENSSKGPIWLTWDGGSVSVDNREVFALANYAVYKKMTKGLIKQGKKPKRPLKSEQNSGSSVSLGESSGCSVSLGESSGSPLWLGESFEEQLKIEKMIEEQLRIEKMNKREPGVTRNQEVDC